MTYTYTYTARNKENPNQVMTFTIVDDHLKVNLTGFIEQVSDAMGEEDTKKTSKEIIKTHSGSALYKAVERLAGPVHINDVSPNYRDGKFRLTFWRRLAGLRFAPIGLSLGNVDNPKSAKQFLDTLHERQSQSDTPGFFAGPLDYWMTWFALVIGVFVLIKWPRKKKA